MTYSKKEKNMGCYLSNNFFKYKGKHMDAHKNYSDMDLSTHYKNLYELSVVEKMVLWLSLTYASLLYD